MQSYYYQIFSPDAESIVYGLVFIWLLVCGMAFNLVMFIYGYLKWLLGNVFMEAWDD